MNFEPKKIAMGLGAAFVALTVWNDPADSGRSTGDFIDNATGWVGDLFDKAQEFSENVVEE